MGAGAARALPQGEVTLLFTDIEGSTRIAQELGGAYGEVLADHHRLLRDVWAAHDGVEVNTEGDAFFVAFSYARAAVGAAIAGQEALSRHRWQRAEPLKVRMGVHTGAVQVRDGDYWGVDVHYAARLCSAAHGGQVLMSASTQALVADAPVEDLGEHAVKDFPVPRRVFHLVAAGRGSGAFPPPRTLGAARTNLPSVMVSLVGRDREIEEVSARLRSDTRLVTLTGIGGSGKTRLALASGAALLDHFEDGVFLVSLAPVTNESDVAGAIAAAIGARFEDGRDPEPTIVEHLAKRQLLLILDNMEHLLGAAALVSRLIESAPGLRVLVTSQAPLRVRAEVAMPLGSLAVPAAGETDPDVLASIDSVALFVERARAADASFELHAVDVGAIAEICRRLDGLPLALELAAARVRLGGPARLLEALERGIDAVGKGGRDLPERQRGLRAALDWTVSLLGDRERDLFAALSVFADAWTIDQLERMFGAEVDVWEAAASLLDFSLIRTRGDGRLTLAEPVRAYAGELLDRQGRRHECSRRHALVFADELEVIHDRVLLDIRAQVASAVEMIEEFAAAIRWAAANDAAIYRRLVAAAGMPYFFTGHLSTVADYIVTLVDSDPRDDDVATRLLMGHSLLLISRQEPAPAVAAAEDAVACSRRIGDGRGLLFATFLQAHIGSTYLGERERLEARELLEAAMGEPAVQGDTQFGLLLDGEVAINRLAAGELDEAEAMFMAITADAGRRDFFDVAAWSYVADCALERGDCRRAIHAYVETLRRMRGAQLYNTLLQCYGIASALAGLGRDRESAELMSTIQTVAERDGGIELPEDVHRVGGALLAGARGRLDEDGARLAARVGRERSLEDTVTWVFSIDSELAAEDVAVR